MVPEARLELAWLSPQHFECCVYTSSTTPAPPACCNAGPRILPKPGLSDKSLQAFTRP